MGDSEPQKMENACSLPDSVGPEPNRFAEDEYQVQLSGTNVKERLEEVATTMQEVIDESVDKMMEFLKKHCGAEPDYSGQAAVLKAKLYTAIPRVLEETKPDLEKLVGVPGNMLLKEDAPQQKRYSEEEIQALEQQREELLQRYERAQQFRALLDAEAKVQDELLPFMEKFVAEKEREICELEERHETVSADLAESLSTLSSYMSISDFREQYLQNLRM